LDPLQLLSYLDAAHATNLCTRQSVTGLLFTLCGTAICYKSKLQATVATSLTKAKFIAAIHTAKIAKYLHSILHELNIIQQQPMPLYVNNQAAIAMANARKPTDCSCHIDIQHFALQEWK
jgi:hypothetical protein